MEQLIGAIQRRTGEARESIEYFFDDLSSGGASAITRAADAVEMAVLSKQLKLSKTRHSRLPHRFVIEAAEFTEPKIKVG